MIISPDHLGRLKNEFVNNKSLKFYNEAYEQKSRSRQYDEVSVFLSHKHSEKVLVEGAIALLNNLGVKVYVDWMDDKMPLITSGQTAVKIKEKIKGNKKFILLATVAAINSKWCNWELGFGDAIKYPKDIAILPIENKSNEWSGNEYLQIYPYITTEYNFLFTDYNVEFNGAKVKLKNWLLS